MKSLSFIDDGSAALPIEARPNHNTNRSDLLSISTLLAGANVLRWDGPDDGSGTLILYLDQDLEVSVHDLGKGLQIDLCVVPEDTSSENSLAGRLATITDRRLPDGWFTPQTKEEALLTLQTLAADWHNQLTNAIPYQRAGNFRAQISTMPEDMAASAIAATESFVAAIVSAGLDEPEFMTMLTHATQYAAAEFIAATNVDEEWRLDPISENAVCAGLPHACFIRRQAGIPISISIEAFTWRADWQSPADPIATLRTLSALRLPAQPSLVSC